MKNVDWSKEPEIRWEKRICPICHEPTGENSQCFSIENPAEIMSSADYEGSAKTIEINGELFPVFAKQCYYRKNNEYWLYTNYPISIPLANMIESIEGIEIVVIRTAYKCSVVRADQFDDAVVKNLTNKKYRDFINGFRKDKN